MNSKIANPKKSRGRLALPILAASFAGSAPFSAWAVALPMMPDVATNPLESAALSSKPSAPKHLFAHVPTFFKSAFAGPFAPGPDAKTAVYDIRAHVVLLPDGTRLEAHSGLGDRADDPRFVRERMQGPTPPALYDIDAREVPFRGVAALRLKPIGSKVFGRTDLLTHTYMVDGQPQSHGCVVFRDYDAFLSAFRQGRVKRLRVVPAFGAVSSRFGSPDRM